jgi:hypothetical protein
MVLFCDFAHEAARSTWQKDRVQGQHSRQTFFLFVAACRSYKLISHTVRQYWRSIVLKPLLIILPEAGLVSFQTLRKHYFFLLTI